MKLVLLSLKNLGRNPVRAALTVLAVVFLVAIFSMIVTVLRFLDRAMAARSADVPIVLTERYRFPSRFDRRFLEDIVSPGTVVNKELSSVQGFRSEKHTLWHFVGFTLDINNRDKNQQFFAIATLPEKLPTMIDEMQDLDPKLCELMASPPKSRLANQGVLMGPDRLKKLGKRVGDVLEATSISHRDGSGQPIKLQVEIVGELPGNSRWAEGAFMDYAYLDRVLKEKKSPLDGKIMLGWLRTDDQPSAATASGVIEGNISDIKSEIASTAVSRFLEPYKNLLNGVKYLLVPAIVVVMTVIVANAISITVRERTREMAVLKVLGFGPGKILGFVLGEALALGALGGLIGATVTFVLVNYVAGGIKIPIGFFPMFFVPAQVFWRGPALGMSTALIGAIIPARGACQVKVSEVSSKVA